MTGRPFLERIPGRRARFVADLLVLSRPVAAICAGAEVLVGAHLTRQASRPAVSGAVLLREGVAISLVTAAVNVVNDIRDVRADAISRPRRPLPDGRLSTRTAWQLAIGQGLAALIISTGVPAALIMALALLFIGVAYSYMLKGTVLVGNFVVAFLAATPLVYGAYLGGGRPAPALVAALLIFSFMFAYEVLKTIRDVAADAAAGYQTVATQWGPRAASVVFRISLAAYAVLAAVPILLGDVSAYYFVFMWLGAVIPSSIAGWRFAVGRSPRAVRLVLRVMTISWIPGLVALAVGFNG